MSQKATEQLNTDDEPDYRAKFFALLGADDKEPDYEALFYAVSKGKNEYKLKDTVIAGLRDDGNEKDAIIAEQNILLRKKDTKIAEYEASTTTTRKAQNGEIKQHAKMLKMEDEIAMLRAAARTHSNPDDLAQIAELKERLAAFEPLARDYATLQNECNNLQKGYMQLMFAHNMSLHEIDLLKQSSNDAFIQEYESVKARNEYLEKQHEADTEQIETLIESNTAVTSQLKAKDNEIGDLKQYIWHLETVANRSSSNTNLPNSKDTIAHQEEHRKKVHNLRVPTGRKPGGQPGHVGAFLKEVPDEMFDEVTREIIGLPQAGTVCPCCGCREFVLTGNSFVQFRYDLKIYKTKTMRTLYECQCKACGMTTNSAEIQNFKEAPNTYGPTIAAIGIYETDVCNAPVEKTEDFIEGITDGFGPSAGWFCKNHHRAAELLKPFRNDTRLAILKLPLIHWDDTVIYVDGLRACFRFYGTESLAFYTAHNSKDLASLLEDGILNMLTAKTIVEHDARPMNYPKRIKFRYTHAVCVIHFLRRLLNTAESTKHKEYEEIRSLIFEALKYRQALLRGGALSFTKEYIDEFNAKVKKLLEEAEKENARDHEAHPKEDFYNTERSFLDEIHNHYDNFFRWMTDFKIPPDNNLSERSLRLLKTKMKVAGQFKSIEAAQDFAIIKSYLDTCERNGIDKYDAINRLTEGTPYTLKEILEHRAA